ncbi:hypothetical protein TTHERM_01351050 (macronuclear) [Tetrahymena thermophila SB210]|uniref:Uncharacterized protein n=1 Tax=Tetrahymena thermophila (strain SB210) TaxID=312017 RepID=Q23UK2_TETTS|nr:hypothetical protein TTHERM_01351050 [Tetrahymena thermophila SB210]EAS00208.2 hypothetical protein TTHERM_01351050 [Tetrahymena thermophila SB210]|eukprot:XP_001020453.2 hypothetical protein TTHERM_01351050 [Tetrahymena thermophila SB210]
MRVKQQKKRTNVLKTIYSFKEIPFLQAQEEVIRGHISQHLQAFNYDDTIQHLLKLNLFVDRYIIQRYLKIFISFYLPRDELTQPKELVRLESSQGGLFKKISPHISEDIVEMYQEFFAHKYFQKWMVNLKKSFIKQIERQNLVILFRKDNFRITISFISIKTIRKERDKQPTNTK